MSDRPLILVSNDDGYDAPGCQALHAALTEVADVVTVAPHREQSAKSHAISLHRPLRHWVHREGVHSVDGTPADCVYVALFRQDLLPRRPDLVVSGINHGPNLGSDVHYSGTVAAAREAALRGIPAIAFSSLGPSDAMTMWAEKARGIALRLLAAPATTDQPSFINVNFPKGEYRGMTSTRLGLRHYADGVEVRSDPRGRDYYWIGGVGGLTHGDMEGSDTAAVDAGLVSITPLSLEVTRSEHAALAASLVE